MRIDRLQSAWDIDVRYVHFPLHPETPPEGLTLEQLAVEVVQDVEESTNGAQTPEHVSRLKKAGLCLVPAAQ